MNSIPQNQIILISEQEISILREDQIWFEQQISSKQSSTSNPNDIRVSLDYLQSLNEQCFTEIIHDQSEFFNTSMTTLFHHQTAPIECRDELIGFSGNQQPQDCLEIIYEEEEDYSQEEEKDEKPQKESIKKNSQRRKRVKDLKLFQEFDIKWGRPNAQTSEANNFLSLQNINPSKARTSYRKLCNIYKKNPELIDKAFGEDTQESKKFRSHLSKQMSYYDQIGNKRKGIEPSLLTLASARTNKGVQRRLFQSPEISTAFIYAAKQIKEMICEDGNNIKDKYETLQTFEQLLSLHKKSIELR